MQCLQTWQWTTPTSDLTGGGRLTSDMAVNERGKGGGISTTPSLLKVFTADPEIIQAMKDEDKSVLCQGSSSSSSQGWHAPSQSIEARRDLVRKKAWQLSILPISSLWMNVVMMYMIGSGGIFTFIILGYALLSAVRVLLAGNKTFDELQTSANTPEVSMLLQRLLYTFFALGFVAYFLIQCGRIGLLPLKEVDLSQLSATNQVRAGGGIGPAIILSIP